MTELLFGLTVLFIGYVIYEVFKTVSATGASAPPTEIAVPAEPAASAKTEAVVADTAPEPMAPTPAAEKGPMLRNPADGETSPAPRNYRFAKKWIKEALVTEGLLPKVYKNSELTVNVTEKVKTALETFKTLEKYQA